MDGIDLAHEVRGALGHPLERMREFPPSGAYMPNDPEAVVFDLVQPDIAGRRPWGFGGQAGRNETGREGTRTRQHNGASR